MTGRGTGGQLPGAASRWVDVLGRRTRRPAGRAVRAVRRRVRRLTYRSTGPCRWLPAELTLDEFFGILRREEVPYVVLRWFDELPEVERGHDVDVLVHDERVDFVQSLLVDRPRKGTQHLDIYSVSGLPRSDLRGFPCFPPSLARQMLSSAVWLRERYRVPDPRRHFLSLAYHAAYHKGYASGLSAGDGAEGIRRPASHDYEAVLADLAARLGESVVLTLDGLDRYLAARDLRPSPDVLRELASSNPWIADHLLAAQPYADPA